jgi:hypothetical protein
MGRRRETLTAFAALGGIMHSRAHRVGVPAIFGMNFQTVSTAQKLPTSDGLTAG